MFSVAANGHNGGLALLWRKEGKVTLISFNKNHIDVIILATDVPRYRLTGVYGEPDRAKRDETWSLIRNLVVNNSLPWCLIGDMNNVLSQSDKRGGKPYPWRLIQGFQNVLQDSDLFDMPLGGHQYTWKRGLGTNKHIEVRLDRALVNSVFLNVFKDAKLTNLETSTSDHSPLLLEPVVNLFVQASKVFRLKMLGLESQYAIR